MEKAQRQVFIFTNECNSLCAWKYVWLVSEKSFSRNNMIIIQEYCVLRVAYTANITKHKKQVNVHEISSFKNVAVACQQQQLNHNCLANFCLRLAERLKCLIRHLSVVLTYSNLGFYGLSKIGFLTLLYTKPKRSLLPQLSVVFFGQP